MEVTMFKENKINQEYKIDTLEIAMQFVKSIYYKDYYLKGWLLQRALSVFICCKENGLNSSYDTKEWTTIYDDVRDHIKKIKEIIN